MMMKATKLGDTCKVRRPETRVAALMLVSDGYSLVVNGKLCYEECHMINDTGSYIITALIESWNPKILILPRYIKKKQFLF